MNSKDETAIEKSIYCKECSQELNIGAKRCYFCGAYQRLNLFHFFNSLSSATAFLIVIVSIISLVQTFQEKQNAEVAVKAAQQALKDTEKARIAAETAKEEAVAQAKELIRNVEAETNAALIDFSTKLVSSSGAIEGLKEDIERESTKINTVVAKTNNVSKDLDLYAQRVEFQNMLIMARNDDRKSYDRLKNWSQDRTYHLQDEATLQYRILQMDISHYLEINGIKDNIEKMMQKLHPNIKNKSFKELANIYKQVNLTQPYVKWWIIVYISERRADITLIDRLNFLVDIIKSDSSLMATKIANVYFKKLSGYQYDGWFDADLTIKYWHENEKNIKNRISPSL